MGAFFVYILKSSACLAVFYLFYRLLMTKDTFHRFNRVALLGLILLSVIIPFCQLTINDPVVIQQSVMDLEELLLLASLYAAKEAVEAPLWIRIVLLLYIGGCLFFVGQFIYSGYRILKMIRKGEKSILESGIRLVIISQKTTPFSWMNYIVISQKDMEENGEEILAHETAHIKARHSIDVLLAEACILFHWFNPAIWLFKQELQNIHEYEADENVLSQGIDAKKYQLLLIKKAVGTQRFTSMANSFNHSSLKKRISMMLRKKSSPWARLKYFYVLPLAAIAVVAFARPEISRELEKISNVKISELVPVTEKVEAKSLLNSSDSIKIELPVSVDVPFMAENMAEDFDFDFNIEMEDMPEMDFSNLNFNIDMPVDIDLSDININVEEFQKKMEKLQEQINANVSVKIEEAVGKALTQKEIDAIVAVEMEKHRAEIEKAMALNQKEIDAMIAVEMKKHAAEIEKAKALDLKEINAKVAAEMEKHKEEIEKAKIAAIDSKEIAQIAKAEAEKHKEEIAKAKEAAKAFQSALKDDADMDKALIYIDGVESTSEQLNKIDQANIERIEVYKGRNAVDEYGPKASNGVILVHTKK